MKKPLITRFALALSLSILAAACGDSEEMEGFDLLFLAEYRAAVPAVNQLAAPAPLPSAASDGEPALYAGVARDMVIGTNSMVLDVVDRMRALIAEEPVEYDSELRRFFWEGVIDEGGYGELVGYVRDMGEDAPFRYHYGLLRGADNISGLMPVIWGGSTPAPDGNGHQEGFILYDLEVSYEFDMDNNPDFDTLALDRGRFAAIYGTRGHADGDLAFAALAFREFVPGEQPDDPPVDLDYFYGRYDDGADFVDFADWQASVDVDVQADRAAAEDVRLRVAFSDYGMGRAEAEAWGGDLAANQTARAVECWDTALDRSYLSLEIYTDGAGETPYQDGDLASCGLFQLSLSELDVPVREDLDPALLTTLDDVAQASIPIEW